MASQPVPFLERVAPNGIAFEGTASPPLSLDKTEIHARGVPPGRQPLLSMDHAVAFPDPTSRKAPGNDAACDSLLGAWGSCCRICPAAGPCLTC